MSHAVRVCVLMQLFVASFLSVNAQDQPKPITAEVTVAATDANYTALRGDSSASDSFSGEYAAVTDLVLKRDAGTFVLKSGEIYFLKPVQGRTVGAVFIGSGEFQITPPTDVEKRSLAIFTDSPDMKEPFNGLTMFFTDGTFAEIQNSPNAKMGKGGPQA